MKKISYFQLCLVLICFTTIGCGIGLSPEQSKAFIFLCGEKDYPDLNNKDLAKSAIDNYSKGSLKKALDQFIEIDSQGCAGERLPAFTALIYAQFRDVESFNVSLEDAFQRSEGNLEVLSFIGFELEEKNNTNFAFSTYEFAVTEIRESLANGKTREEIRGKDFAEDGSLVEWRITTEASLLGNSVCFAAKVASHREQEYRRLYKTVLGYDPTCTITHNKSLNADASDAGAG